METKICSKCYVKKSVTKFGKRAAKYQPYCLSCQSETSKQWYRENRKRQQTNIRKNTGLFQQSYKRWKSTLSCVCCGENAVECLDFHHLDPSQKKFEIGSGCNHVGKQKLCDEINKCIVVCKNCHAKLHANSLKLQKSVKKCNITVEVFATVSPQASTLLKE